MYYEVRSGVITHPHIPYNDEEIRSADFFELSAQSRTGSPRHSARGSDGIRRIFLYVDGDLPEAAGENEKRLRNLLCYIGKSTEENVKDENTGKLNTIVRKTKEKKDIGIRYMKTWERERELIQAGRNEEHINTEIERQRADNAEQRAKSAEQRAKSAEQRAEKAEARVKELEAIFSAAK
ncbi:MAG: hypothetical protein K5985_06705 [Lachnospiraceae bacterium]|nr:hypothetical protein [Lachnospiraceae bacterium]